jgi:hypothetical protein
MNPPAFYDAKTWFCVLVFCTFSAANLSAQSSEPEQAGQAAPPAAASTEMQWQSDATGVSLMQGDTLVLRYEAKSGSKPIVYPIYGPDGVSMTRDFPMKEWEKDGSKDHFHHRSLWMTHGEVNGIDFWMEGDKAGKIIHEDVVSKEVHGDGARLVTTANWITPDGKQLLHESRTMVVVGDESLRGIEFLIDLTAGDQEVHFGDTKEGSFGIRVPDSMSVDKKLGGTILNEHGDRDGDTWGKRSRWVDYSGPVGDKVAGLTLLEHPSSFGHPCRWHVRTYGLFAANPFGQHHFVGGKPTEGHKLQPGQSLHFHYKLLVHEGSADPNLIEDQWKKFAE